MIHGEERFFCNNNDTSIDDIEHRYRSIRRSEFLQGHLDCRRTNRDTKPHWKKRNIGKTTQPREDGDEQNIRIEHLRYWRIDFGTHTAYTSRTTLHRRTEALYPRNNSLSWINRASHGPECHP
mmetsp:Transcript_18013/g.41525  ORF Transcript_18013/g.41525 Transcript_18013/m.41525 type:complete len:123 (-) Transcript_18013:1937-2305(-)